MTTNPNFQDARIGRFNRATGSTADPPAVTVERIPGTNMDTILIVCDEMVNYGIMPDNLRNMLPGFLAFKQIGVEFTNIHNNRQDCSPSRASFQSSAFDVGIGDNIDQPMQYPYVPQLGLQFDTMGKAMKSNGINTAYFGKNHFFSSIGTDVYQIPLLNTNTRGCMKQYGFDAFNTYGDTYYYQNRGYLGDDLMFNFETNNSSVEVDYIDNTGKKYIGVLPYLKARATDGKKFHLQSHFINPHDTMHFWQNFGQTPTKGQLQYWAPYIDEQIAAIKARNPSADATNPYFFDNLFPNAYVQNKNLVTNYFETDFVQYSENRTSLPFLTSYTDDYATDPLSNSVFPFFTGMAQSFSNNFTFPYNSTDYSSWKNLINNYYGLIIESDFYIFQIYKQLETSGMLNNTAVVIVSDHGDMMSAHGLKQKGYHFRESVNVCCVVYSPFLDASLKNTTSTILGSLIDIAPTMEVLANTVSKSSQFQGQSLLNWVGNNLEIRTSNNPVLNIVYSWMNAATYVYFKQWYFGQSPTIQNKIVSGYQSPNFYEYINFYSMIITELFDTETNTTKQYKLARYYSFVELYDYNFKVNTALSNAISADDIVSYLPDEITYNSNFASHIQTLYTQITNYLTANTQTTFEFGEMYTHLKTLNASTNQTDSLILSTYMTAISGYVIDAIGMSLLIPGYMSTTIVGFPDFGFTTLYNDPDYRYYYFMYDVTNDPSESVNLLDKRFPTRQSAPVLSKAAQLNAALNDLMDTYNLRTMQTIVPQNVNVSVLLNLLKYGENVQEYTSAQSYDFATYSGQNNMDSPSMNPTYTSFTKQSLTVPVPRLTFWNGGTFYWNGASAAPTSSDKVLTGAFSNNAVIYVGPINNTSLGTITTVGLSGATKAIIYKGQYNTSTTNYNFVGTAIQTSSSKQIGFVYVGTIGDMNGTSSYTAISPSGNAFTVMHAIQTPLAVGNTSTTAATTAQGFIYNTSTTAITNVIYPGALTTVVYGIYFNSGASYTIVGGYSSSAVNSQDIYTTIGTTAATYTKPIENAFIVDYNSTTGVFSNWSSFTYNMISDSAVDASKVHFTSIDVDPNQSNVYNMSATTMEGTNAIGLRVSIARLPNSSFSNSPQITKINFITDDDQAEFSTTNSLCGNVCVGFANLSPNDTIGYQCKIVTV